MLYIYLDQNKWIDLAKARSGKYIQLRDDAEYLLCEVKKDRIRLPMSSIHIMEASRIGNNTQRKQLVDVFLEYGNGLFIINRSDILFHQMFCAISEIMNCKISLYDFSPLSKDILLSFSDYKNLSLCLQRSETHLQELSDFVESKQMIKNLMEFPDDDNRKESLQHMKGLNDEIVNRILNRMNKWGNISRDLRYRAYSALLFTEYIDKIEYILKIIGKNTTDLFSLPKEKLVGLLDKIPMLDIERTLAIEIEQQKSRSLQGNDVYDIAWLSHAIPYCDVVVTEKLWCHIINLRHVDSVYNTMAMKTISELVSFCRKTSDNN